MLKICGIYLFTAGFLLTKLVLDHKSECAVPPIALGGSYEAGSSDQGCWHPKTFNKAVVIVIDALRYDFTIPFQASEGHPVPHQFHDSIPVLYESAVSQPENAVLLPFIADPPTTTLQRLKGLTTGTLPTFIDAGSNFAGTAIDEDNLIAHLREAGQNVVHLGDDTWHSLFPGYFDPNLTKSYDSFNVWDLHTVDNGVTKHLIPLLRSDNSSKWDILIGHYLGVDHAGHRYGPDHPAMKGKLQQMDGVIREVMQMVDDETLLVIMGDHGMDSKGDHGGESSDEVEAALWMYSKSPRFGRTSQESMKPPPNAKVRPVNQIDLVPSLALLLGLPIPFNNLGAPIEEAFIGTKGTGYENLAVVNRLTAAQIHRYQAQYALVRKPDPLTMAEPNRLWNMALDTWEQSLSGQGKQSSDAFKTAAAAFSTYQSRNLQVCKDLWARFDIISMSLGITILIATFTISVTIAQGVKGDLTALAPVLLVRGLIGLLSGGTAGFALGSAFPTLGLLRTSIFSGSLLSCATLAFQLWSFRRLLSSLIPSSVWSRACILSILLLSVGFGANSFTIWEDEILLYFLAFFGVLMVSAVFRLPSSVDRRAGFYHAAVIMIAVRLTSLSRLCREEQMPYCRSTFYASATSSTSAPWQLALPWLVALILPATIKAYYQNTQSYHGSAPFWIGFAFQGCLFLVAVYWTIDAADNGNWFTYVDNDFLQTVRIYIAQFVLAIAVGAGSATFTYQSPCIGVETIERDPTSATKPPGANGSAAHKTRNAVATEEAEPAVHGSQLVVHGTANLYGSHFAVLPFTVIAIPLLLVAKPMGQAALALTILTILSLLELLHLLQKVPRSRSFSPSTTSRSSTAINLATNLRATQSNSATTQTITTVLAPTLFALLAHFAFFKTGHQAALSSIQWDAAFIPLRTIRYPWSPMLIALNSFAGQMLCAAAAPAAVLWRRSYTFSTGNASVGGGEGTTTFGPSAEKSDNNNKIPSSSEQPTHDPRHAARSHILTLTTRALLTHFTVYGALNLATTVFAAHLRRHLMLYRVFSPRWMLGVAGMGIAEVVGVWVGLGGVGRSVGAVAGVFGW